MIESQKITRDQVYEALKGVIDPELHIDIVSLGLVYDVMLSEKQLTEGAVTHIHVLLTLTTPGCPLAHMFEDMIREALNVLPLAQLTRDVTVELTFDPPWIPDMMTEEAKAELGFD